jgi:hypothetical protein
MIDPLRKWAIGIVISKGMSTPFIQSIHQLRNHKRSIDRIGNRRTAIAAHDIPVGSSIVIYRAENGKLGRDQSTTF